MVRGEDDVDVVMDDVWEGEEEIRCATYLTTAPREEALSIILLLVRGSGQAKHLFCRQSTHHTKEHKSFQFHLYTFSLLAITVRR